MPYLDSWELLQGGCRICLLLVPYIPAVVAYPARLLPA